MQTHPRLAFTETEVRKRYVSWDRGEADREWACLTLLAEHAPGVAPRPLRRETDDGAPVVVMERLPGEPLGRAPLTPEQTHSLGSALRRLYDVPVESIRGAQLTERVYGPTTHARTVTAWLSDSYDLAECRDPGLVVGAMDAALAWLAPSGSRPESHLVALGIADLNPANILWDGDTCRLVDFEDGGLTDPAYELADHTEHIGGRLSGVFDREALVDAAGLSADERERMRAYRPLWGRVLARHAAAGQRGLPAQSARHDGGTGRPPPGTARLTPRAAQGPLSLDSRGPSPAAAAWPPARY